MSETTPALRTGTQLGPYRLRRLLGGGGMGEVYEAEDIFKDRVVALKLMSQELSSDPLACNNRSNQHPARLSRDC